MINLSKRGEFWGEFCLPFACLILFFILCLLFLSILLEIITDENVGTREVDCYDHHDNKILNQTCEKTIFCGILSKYVFKTEECAIKVRRN